MKAEDYNENYGNGWISLFRSIRSHWVWGNSNYLKWWIDILLEANHSGKKVTIGYKLFDCNRGESIRSLRGWSQRWGVSKTVVNNFFKLLENDNMIKTVNETVTTRIIVCNYGIYQQNENASKTHKTTQTKRNSTALEPQQSTNNKDNKGNNVNNDNKEYSKEYGNPEINEVYDHFLNEAGSLDGTKKENRRYAHLLLNKLKKDFPDFSAVDSAKALITRGRADNFHSKNLTGFKYLYYNRNKIINSINKTSGQFNTEAAKQAAIEIATRNNT